MKKNNSMRIAIVVIALTLITSCFVGTTFAKYTATITNTADTARVAKFVVSAFDKTATATENTATLALFDISKVYDARDLYANDADYAAAAKTDDLDIKNGTGDDVIIAPGSWGTFSYTITNGSEVSVTYAITYTVSEAGVPLQWSTDGVTWTDSLANVPAAEATYDGEGTLISQGTELEVGAAAVPVNVYWRWVFEGDDNTLGFAGSASPSVQISVTFTQVD